MICRKAALLRLHITAVDAVKVAAAVHEFLMKNKILGTFGTISHLLDLLDWPAVLAVIVSLKMAVSTQFR